MLITKIIPRRIEASDGETIVIVRHRGKTGRRICIDHSDIDALTEAHPKTAVADFPKASLPLLPGLPEEIVIEQMQMLGVDATAPNVGDSVDRARLALFFRDDTEPAFETAAARRKTDAPREIRIDRIIKAFAFRDAKLLLDRDGAAYVPRTPDDSARKLAAKPGYATGCKIKNSRAIDRAIFGFKHVAIRGSAEMQFVAALPVICRQLHQGKVWELAVKLGKSDVHGSHFADPSLGQPFGDLDRLHADRPSVDDPGGIRCSGPCLECAADRGERLVLFGKIALDAVALRADIPDRADAGILRDRVVVAHRLPLRLNFSS